MSEKRKWGSREIRRLWLVEKSRFFFDEFRAELEAVSRLATWNADSVHEELLEIEKRYEQWLNESDDPEEVNYLIDAHADERGEAEERLTFLSRSSTVVAAFSLHEVFLERLCNTCRELGDVSLAVRDMRGRGVDRSRLYLKKVILLDFPDSIEWQRTQQLRKIRNSIVQRRDTADYKRISKALKEFPDAHLKDRSRLQLDPGFPHSAIKCLLDFWCQLETSASPRISELRAQANARLPIARARSNGSDRSV